MPIITQSWIIRADLRSNPSVLYLFGDNVKRVGFGGQAKEMRGEPNAIGIATKWSPSMTPSAFFSDVEYMEIHKIIEDDFRQAVVPHLKSGGIVVLPADGLGTGLSRLAESAPKVNAFLLYTLRYLRRY